MSRLIEQIKQKDACAFTHGGKFHADDVFSSALLLYINPEISITRGNSVPDDFTGIVFDIGRGEFDHHQKDSRIRENGVPYAAFGLLWEAVGADILGEELAVKFDESFVQPLDNNDNTGEKNELATLIGNFNPSWDYEGGSDEAFFQAVSVAGMILENKFERYRGNERADKRVEEVLAKHDPASRILENKFERYRGNERADKRVEEVLAKHDPASRILVLPEFIPCQKALSETDIAFVIFPSNRGGFCIQPQKREYSMNYKCSFPAEWLGLEGEELVNATGIPGAIFCHKGGFIMTVKEQDEAVKACEKALSLHKDSSVIVWYGSKGDTAAKACDSQTDELLMNVAKARGIKGVHICHVDAMPVPQLELTELDSETAYAEVLMEKPQWKAYVKEQVKQIVKYRPEAVYVEGNAFETYPVIRALRKKHIPVLTMIENKEKKIMVRIP